MIDFSLTAEQQSVLDTIDVFLDRRLPPDEVRRRDREHVGPYDLLGDLAEIGVLGLPFAAEYGGLAQPWVTLALVQERLARRAYFSASIVSRVVAFGGMSLVLYGSSEQRDRLLPELIGGRALVALALSEPEAGSDAGAITTRATPTDTGWCIRGRKTWISDADAATHLLVPARTPGGGTSISAFLVPRATPGISMTRLEKVGNHCMASFEIGFDEVEVGRCALMGEEGRGLQHVLSTLAYSRASLAAAATGTAQAAVDIAVAHARERHQFGRPIGANQVIRHRLADMQMRVDQARWASMHLAWLISEGSASRRHAAQAKVIASEALQYVARHGMHILASAGYSDESDMQRIWRDAQLSSFGEGSNEIQRDIIGRELGL